jgi:hypothetical protein
MQKAYEKLVVSSNYHYYQYGAEGNQLTDIGRGGEGFWK